MSPAGAARFGRLAAAIASGIALLAVAAWVVTRPAASGSHDIKRRSNVDPAPAPAAPAPAAAAPATISRVELPPAASATDPDDSARVDRAVEVAIAALLRNLADPDWNRGRWNDELGALAGGLPEGAKERIAKHLRDPAADAATRIVAAELLRACGGERDELAASGCVELLRRTALDGGDDSSASQVAARPLAWLGEEEDLTRLSDLLVRPRSEQQRTAAVWALREAPCARLVPALVRQLRGCAEGTRDEWSADSILIALDDSLRRQSGGAPPRAVTCEAVELLERLVSDARTTESTWGRALTAGATLAAHDDGARGSELLHACLADAGAPASRRMRAAQLLLGLPREAATAARRDALDHLLAVARDGATVQIRRQAWSALAAADRDAVGDLLVELEKAEQDASVREVAERTLARVR